MPRKRVRKKHSVKAQLQVMELSKAGTSLELESYAAKQKIGTLTLGRGSLYWRGRSHRLWKRIAWTRFAEMMDDLAYEQK